MYRLAVCEDEEAVRDDLCLQCRNILSSVLRVEHEVVPFPSAEALEGALATGERFDLLCLDILMAGKSGMELAREVRTYDDRVSILFITGSEEFLKEGYAVRPIQYLFKPVQEEELERALRTDLRLYHQPRNLTLRAGNQAVVLPLEQIWYIESHNHTVEVWGAREARTFWVRLSRVEELLPPGRFCRCHNSFLVNLEHVAQIGRREVLLDDGRAVPVSRSFCEAVREQFVRFLNMR